MEIEQELDERDGRYHLMVWQFGDIWQCRVDVYDDKVPSEGAFIPQARFCLDSEESFDAAIAKARRTVEELERGEHQLDVHAYLRRAFVHYPTISGSVFAVLRHALMCGGNGVDWCDGKMLTTPLDDADADPYASYNRQTAMRQDYADLELDLPEEFFKPRAVEAFVPGPDPDTRLTSSLTAWGTSNLNIYRVPSNVSDGWLQACWHVLDVVRRLDVDDAARQLAESTLEDLKARFGDRLIEAPLEYTEKHTYYRVADLEEE